jgi:hypothetical protein
MKVRDVIKMLEQDAGTWIALVGAIGSTNIQRSRVWSQFLVSRETTLALELSIAF